MSAKLIFFITTIFIKIALFFKQFEPHRPASNERYFNYLSFETDLASVAEMRPNYSKNEQMKNENYGCK